MSDNALLGADACLLAQVAHVEKTSAVEDEAARPRAVMTGRVPSALWEERSRLSARIPALTFTRTRQDGAGIGLASRLGGGLQFRHGGFAEVIKGSYWV